MPMRNRFGNFPALMQHRPRETVLLAAAASILIALTFFTFWLTARVRGDAETADELSRYNTKLTEFGQMLRTAESSQRGYLITGTPAFLDSYNEMSVKLLPLAQDLAVTAPKQLSSVSILPEIVAPLRAKLMEMEETIALVKAGQKGLGAARVNDGFGRGLTDEIESKVSAVQMEGASLIRSFSTKERETQRIKDLVSGAGALLILAFSFFSLRSLLHGNAAIQAAQDKLATANLELEHTVAQRTAALTRANEEIQRFAYIVSHDLRSPLINIMGFTSELEILRNELFESLGTAQGEGMPEKFSKEFDEAFGFIKSSIARMDRLISAILRISREGGRPINWEPVDANALIEGLFAAVEHQVRDRGASLKAHPLPSVTTDRLALEQIFSNLIDNAIKFLKPDSNGQIEVAGHIHGAEVIYTVSDNGLGIDTKDHGRIFELFRRSGQHGVPGEGIGLAYVATLVRRLGGAVEVESALGRGSMFKVRLPRAVPVAGKRAA
jgi:signal transduction histidine kinase